MSKFVPVEEAEAAIARANGETALTAIPAPVANGLAPSRDHSAIQVGCALLFHAEVTCTHTWAHEGIYSTSLLKSQSDLQ